MSPSIKKLSIKALSLIAIFALFYFFSPIVQNKLGLNRESKHTERDELFEEFVANTKLPVLDLYIGSESQKLLKKDKVKALNSFGHLFSDKESYVSCYIKTDYGVKKCKTRLKGDLADHISGKITSLRVKVKKGTFLGLSDFTLQNPKSRNGFRGILLYKMMKMFGVMGIKQVPVLYRLNNEIKGVVLVESHFSDSRIFELNKRRPGIIYKSYEDFIWKQRYANKKSRQHIFDLRRFDMDNKFLNYFMGNHPNIASVAREFDFQFNYNNTPFRVFNEGEVKKDPIKFNDYQRVLGVIRAYQEGMLDNDQIFNMKKIAYFVAISNLFSTWHGIVFTNMKFYWNPYSDLIEPVSYDNYVSGQHEFRFYQPFFFRVQTSDIFIEEYKNALADIKSKINEIIIELREEEIKILSEVQGSSITSASLDPYWINFSKKLDYLIANPPVKTSESKKMEIFKTQILNKNAYINNPLVLYRVNNELQIINTLNIPVVVKKMEFKYSDDIESEFRVPETKNNLGKYILNDINLSANDSEVKVTFNLFGKPQTELLQIIDYVNPISNLSRCQGVPLPSFIKRNGLNNYFIPIGSYKNVGSICLLSGYNNLTIESGAILEFNKDSRILLNGNLNIGTIGNGKTILTAQGSWRGIMVNGSKNSIIKNVDFLNGLQEDLYPYSGFINFHDSKITFKNVTIKNITAEDTINFISSNFIVDNVKIYNVSSDAIDFDFADGKILNSYFENVKGDALDFSNSNSTVQKNKFIKISDKAISAGEQSNIIASELDVSDSDSLAASKDGSNLSVLNSKGKNLKNGILVYKKKGLYTGAHAKTQKVIFEGVDNEYLCQRESSLLVGNVEAKCLLARIYDSYDLSGDR